MSPSAALLPLVVIGGLIAWWAWKVGAYFDVVLLPGTILLLTLLVALLLFAPWPGRLRGAGRIALFALLGVAAWTLISTLWSPAQAVAVADAQRVLAYGVAFALGTWLCLLLGRRMLLALAPLAGAGAVVAVATLIALWVGDNVGDFLEDDATLRYPLGYRNAEAAFFGIALFPMLVLAASRDVDWRARGALVGAATLSIELAVLSESRAAVFAVAIGLAVLIAVHPARLRMVGYAALVALPVLPALPWLLDVFGDNGSDTVASLAPLHTACVAAAATSGVSLLIGLVVARREPSVSPGAQRAIGRALLAVVGIGLLVGVFALLRADGGPGGVVTHYTDQLNAGTPDLSAEGSRFGIDLRSGRGDIWRVAIDDFQEKPLAGEGSGGFRTTYLLHRDPDATEVQPEDPHSVELLMASELGVPGLLLFAAFVIAAVVAALRSRRLGPSAAALAGGALGAFACWFVGASVDWFWHYPVITLPVAFALGAAAAPALLHPPGPPKRVRRGALVLVALVIAAALVPPFLSERYTKQALGNWRNDLAGAYADLDKAADLNPLSERPLSAEAVIAESADEPQRALAALSEAQKRNPDEWTLYYLQARALEPSDPAGAQRALSRATELNPYGPEIKALQKRFDADDG